MIDDDEFRAVGGIRSGRGKGTTRRKPATVQLVNKKSHMT
jgi:hypothetical protein